MLAHTTERSPDLRGVLMTLEPALYARAMRLERSTQDAWDLVQDTQERALRSLGQFQSGTDPATNVRQWMFRIMFNLFVDRCRRRTLSRAWENIDGLEVRSPEPEPPEPWWMQIDPEEVHGAFSSLPPLFQEVLTMKIDRGCSYQQISQLLGIPVATVGTRLLRARKRLQILLTSQQAQKPRELSPRYDA